MITELIELLNILKSGQYDANITLSSENVKKKIFALETAIEILKEKRL